jgi:hypothetical protein
LQVAETVHNYFLLLSTLCLEIDIFVNFLLI